MTPDDAPVGPPDDERYETLCQHYAEHRFAHLGAVSPPLYQTSNFVYPTAEMFVTRDDPDPRFFDYTRRANPTTNVLEAKLARLENGTWARCFASGMGAITAAIASNVEAGAHIVSVRHCYGPTHRYISDHLRRFGVQSTFVNSTQTQDFIDAIHDDTRVMYLESPTSGRYDILDVPGIAAAAGERGVVTIFDNSWATPYFQRPLDHGCDLVVHSATKYIGGHSDVLGGVVAGRDDGLRRCVAAEAELLGASLDPFAAWLLMRGLRTLPVRMRQHQESSLTLARWLDEHPAVERVCHPGLETNPQHALACRQMRGFAGVFSFLLRDQSQEATHRFLNRLKTFRIGCSWGGYESLALGGPTSTLFTDDPDQTTWVIRLHVGLEDTRDLLDDVRQALEE